MLIALSLWVAVPIALQAVDVARHGGLFSGGVAYTPQDMFQYLWWVRDSGMHVLIADPYQLVGHSQHVFLQPMALLSGLLWRLGLSLPLALILPWAPVSVALTFFTFRAYVRRHIGTRSGASAALLLALFFFAPAAYEVVQGQTALNLKLLDLDGSTALALWGYFPRVIAVALIPLVLLQLERILVPRTGKRVRSPVRLSLPLAALGLAIAWLHPWQGAEVVMISVLFTVWTRPRRRTAFALLGPAVGSLIGLAYYAILDRFDIFWRTAQAQSHELAWRFSPQLILLAFLPLALAALFAMRRRLPREPHRRLLLLWVVSCVIGYGVIASDSAHALDGLVVPLSILAVLGWQRIGLATRIRGISIAGIRPAGVIAVLAIIVCSVPGAWFWLRILRQGVTVGQTFPNADVRALRYMETDRQPGGVLAALPIAYAVPSYTGRNVFTSSSQWTPRHKLFAAADGALYAGRVSVSNARQIVAGMGARFMLVDCGLRTTLPQKVAPLITGVHRFGCATVYELRTDPKTRLFPVS